MYRVVFELATFRDGRDRDWLGPLLVPLVEALAVVDLAFLKRNSVPPLYSSKVYYKANHETCDGCEDLWWDVPQILAHGYGDCEDLVAWRIAEYWMAGHRARAMVTPFVDAQKRTVYHVQVLLPDGSKEDPSARLGMR